jgi:nitrous oxidase accessory protein
MVTLPRLMLVCLWLTSVRLAAAELHVGAGQPFASISTAIVGAAEGDTIVVHGGTYREGNLRVGKLIHLVGVDAPVLDGELKSEILTINASDVTVRGFSFRNGGRSSINDLAGIRVESAARVTIEGNDLRNCNFAIYLARARDCTIRRNGIEGDPGTELSSGNGIHLWSCEGTHIADNSVRGHRDGIYLEFASKSVVEANVVENNMRYGLHFMTSHDSAYRKNRFSRNGAGVAVMYSRHVEMSDNVFEYSWGGSAYGLLLKDITDSEIRGNKFQHNSTAIYAQGATRVLFERNQFDENGWALRILSSGMANTFRENNFTRNTFDVATNGQLTDHKFTNNYWDRYEGYDLNRDGLGDVPFRPVGLYSTMVEQVPASAILMRSFLVHLMDRAEKALPSIAPDEALDSAPSIRRHTL